MEKDKQKGRCREEGSKNENVVGRLMKETHLKVKKACHGSSFPYMNGSTDRTHTERKPLWLVNKKVRLVRV